MNISAALFAIPVILFFYELIKGISDSRLNGEIFGYGKMQVDREVLGIAHQLMKILYPFEDISFGPASINNFLSLSKEDIQNILVKNEYFGFQVLRSWEVYEEKLEGVLKNSFIIQKLDNGQVIAIIEILKSMRDFEQVQNAANMFIQTGKKETKYKLVKGDEINPANSKYPDRFLLLRHNNGDLFQVVDFPDIPRYNEKNALNTYKLNPAGIKYYGEAIYSLITDLGSWVSMTGNEFLIDTKQFRMGHRYMKA